MSTSENAAHRGNGNGIGSTNGGDREGNGGSSARKEIFGIVERNEQSYWTRIGVAFENRDGSWNLRFDFFPSRGDVKIQMREPREREARPSEREG